MALALVFATREKEAAPPPDFIRVVAPVPPRPPPKEPTGNRADPVRPPPPKGPHPPRVRIPTAPPEITPTPPAPAPEPLEAPSPVDPGQGEPSALPGTGPIGDPLPGDGCPPGARCEAQQHLTEIINLQGGMTTPRPDASCQPPTPLAPAAASQFGLEGRVVARFVVHADGRADSLQVLNDDAPPVFVDAVRAFLERCAFTPSVQGGQPVSVRMAQTFRFRAR